MEGKLQNLGQFITCGKAGTVGLAVCHVLVKQRQRKT